MLVEILLACVSAVLKTNERFYFVCPIALVLFLCVSVIIVPRDRRFGAIGVTLLILLAFGRLLLTAIFMLSCTFNFPAGCV